MNRSKFVRWSALGLLSVSCGGMETGTTDRALLVVGPDGTATIASPWVPPYNIVDNHCHNAAAANCSDPAGTDGFISCTSIGSWTSGHTINWAPDPVNVGAGNFCAYEPQSNGGTVASGAVCCWTGATNANGTPSLTDAAARPCVTALCAGQADYGWFGTTPVAWPPGATPPVAQVCSSLAERDACTSCCDSQAATQLSNFPTYAAQVEDYRLRCRLDCGSIPLPADTAWDITRPGSNDSPGIAQGRICVDNTSMWSFSSRLTQCLSCCGAAGYGSPAGSTGTTSCEAVCNAAYR